MPTHRASGKWSVILASLTILASAAGPACNGSDSDQPGSGGSGGGGGSGGSGGTGGTGGSGGSGGGSGGQAGADAAASDHPAPAVDVGGAPDGNGAADTASEASAPDTASAPDVDLPDSPPPRKCGGKSGLTCDAGEFCDVPGGTCGLADELGVCTRRPQRCQAVFSPVCGCDGMSYNNDCERESAGVSRRSVGRCP